MTTFLARLQELKTVRGVMQKDIAAGINIPLRTYQRYEYGEREPQLSALIQLADFYNVSLEYLIGRSDDEIMGNTTAVFSERLVALRKEAELAQTAAAEKCGVVVRAYQRYEYGEREPQLSTLVKIADFYGVSIDYLAGRTDER